MAPRGAVAAALPGVGKSGLFDSFSEVFVREAAKGVSSSPGMTRIYVGGLSGGVTEADVEKTFAPLGTVSSIEFVRTKGRAFAYIDFEPKTDKSLAKLFTAYNGCIWKGGRLRLEKAKEHYLTRLKWEWAEDAEPSKNRVIADTNEGFLSSDKLKQMTEDKMQLRIFFPKLRKVKVLPFKGTGKHKYSFQRIAVPSRPVHFCDCEEHYHFPEDPRQENPKDIKEQKVVSEKELGIMNCVMKKLFEKEAKTNAAGITAIQARKDILDVSRSETQSGDRDVVQQSESDAENLVTNIGVGNEDGVECLMQLKGWDAATPDQGTFGKGQYTHKRLISKQQIARKRRRTEPGTFSETPFSISHILSEEPPKSKENDLPTAVAGEIGPRETENQERNDFSAIRQEGSSNYHEEEPENTECNKTNQKSSDGQLGKSTSWVQKSSWKELVGDSHSSMFTISHVLPSVNHSRSRTADPCYTAGSIMRSAVEPGKPHASISFQNPVEAMGKHPVKKISAPMHDKERSDHEEHAVDQRAVDEAPRCQSSCQNLKTGAPLVGLGQVCTFMRSADSLKEWSKAKAALSGQLKKKKQQQ